MSDDRTKRAKRLQRTSNAIKKQLRIAKAFGMKHVLKQPHRLAKHHALDCGNPKCLVCHSDKIFHKRTLTEQRFIEANKITDIT